MAKTPRRLGWGEGGKNVPTLEELMNDIAEDLKLVFETLDTLTAGDVTDDDRRHKASYED